MIQAILALSAVGSLVVPLCISIVALARLRRDFYIETVRILGTMFILTACGLAVVGALGALLRGEQPVWPYLVMTGLPTLAVVRIMQLQGITLIARHTP